MSLAVALYVTALSLPLPAYPREAFEDRAQRLAVIALAIAAETERADEWDPGWTRSDWAWAGFSKTWVESGRFHVDVHSGKLSGDNGRSTCLGQIMHGGSRLVGVDYDATRRCYHEVFRILLLHQKRCLLRKPTTYSVGQLFGAYGTGHTCRGDLPWAMRRAWLWSRVSQPTTE